MAAGTVRSWIADDDGQAQGSVSVLALDMAPRPEDHSSIDGFVINLIGAFVIDMHVLAPRRRRCVGDRLLDELLVAARQQGIRRLMLYPTPDGAPLYAGAGFQPRPDFVELAFAKDRRG